MHVLYNIHQRIFDVWARIARPLLYSAIFRRERRNFIRPPDGCYRTRRVWQLEVLQRVRHHLNVTRHSLGLFRNALRGVRCLLGGFADV